jgi:hypothetical protein
MGRVVSFKSFPSHPKPPRQASPATPPIDGNSKSLQLNWASPPIARRDVFCFRTGKGRQSIEGSPVI